MIASRRPPSRLEWLALVLAIAIAHAFHARLVRYPSAFDAENYLQIAQDIAANGLFRPFYYSQIRTYGYPLFLAGLEDIAQVIGVAWSLVYFEVQLALYLGACIAVRSAVAHFDIAFARWVFGTLVLNVFALSYTPESLTESLSLALVMFAAALWIRLRDPRTSLWWPVLAGSLLLSFAVMVRPAALFALFAWPVALALAAWERRIAWRRAGVLALVFVAGSTVPMLPQLANNMRFHDQATPLVAARLGTNQQIWGIQYIKYATALPPVPNPSIFYDNPFARDRPIDPERPLAWYVAHPVAGVATLGLHVFNMLDQDLLFTYSRDLEPWYRVPVGILGHAMVALACIGAVLLVRRRRALTVTALAILALVLAHVAVHATTAVEMRFGLPLLVLAGPMAAWAWGVLRKEAPRRTQVVAATCVAAYVVAAFVLSGWVREQAPSIRAWHAAHGSAWWR